MTFLNKEEQQIFNHYETAKYIFTFKGLSSGLHEELRLFLTGERMRRVGRFSMILFLIRIEEQNKLSSERINNLWGKFLRGEQETEPSCWKKGSCGAPTQVCDADVMYHGKRDVDAFGWSGATNWIDLKRAVSGDYFSDYVFNYDT